MLLFLFGEFIPLNSKYTVKRPKNNPNGSDLNHPIGPRINIGNEIENNRAENKPAVVPPMTLTKAKRTIADTMNQNSCIQMVQMEQKLNSHIRQQVLKLKKKITYHF